MKNRIQKVLIKAMKEKNTKDVSTLRLILTAINNHQIENPGDENLVPVLDKMVKQRKESIAQFMEGNRPDLVDGEMLEITLIDQFLPKRMTTEEVAEVAKQYIDEQGFSSMRDMGKAMGYLKNKLGDKASPSEISSAVKNILSGK